MHLLARSTTAGPPAAEQELVQLHRLVLQVRLQQRPHVVEVLVEEPQVAVVAAVVDAEQEYLPSTSLYS